MNTLIVLFAGLALLNVQTSAIEAITNPMEKVVELLGVLNNEIEKEGAEDEAAYKEYKETYSAEVEKGEAIVKENSAKVAQLSSDLKEAEAFREGKNKELVDTANKIAKNSAELSASQDQRKKDRALFEKNEATFIESLDQVERALGVLGKKNPIDAAAGASSASLLSVAAKLKTMLTHDPDVDLSTSQRDTLETFQRLAQAWANEKPFSFLQRDVSKRGPYGEFESSSGGLIGTLEELKTKVSKERQDALTEEEKAKKEFEEFESGLTSSLENDKKSLSNIKTSIAQSQEQSSQKQATLLEAQELVKVENEHLERIRAAFRVKSAAYDNRLHKRMDENIAIHEASRMLKSYTADQLVAKQSIGTTTDEYNKRMSTDPLQKHAAKMANTFLQIQKRSLRKRVARLLKKGRLPRKVTTPGLVLLAMKSRTKRFRHRVDPFAKVRSMVKNMLEKLNEMQAQETKHAAWCDKEMHVTAVNMRRKEEEVQKTEDRLAALEAELTQTDADIETAQKDLDEIQKTTIAAQKVRAAEHKHATSAMKEYVKAAKMLTKAKGILQTYYKEAGEDEHRSFKERRDLGNGVIAILEIAIEDFRQLYAEIRDAEDAAERDYRDMKSESEIRQATFQKDLEWKSKRKVKLEFAQTTMNNDLKSYEQELSAINTYNAELQASCVVKGPSYEERKARREAELASLREALDALKSQR
jgi:hypothetical protein